MSITPGDGEIHVHDGRTFDARPSRDPRNSDYPVRAVLPGPGVPPVRKMWRRGAVLDQGPDGQCVGHAWAAEAAGSPARVDFTRVPGVGASVHEAARLMYAQAQQVDEWPGEDYSGTSVNAGAKVMRSLGLIGSYRWCFTAADLRDTLITTGPVVLAIPWLSGMFETSPGGEVTVSGREVGWHAVLLNGYDPAASVDGKPPREMVRLQNSWGTGWAAYGSAWVAFDALWGLIDANDGDVCVPLDRRVF